MKGVSFLSRATFQDLLENKDVVHSSLLTKLEQVRNGEQAYQWWRGCTEKFDVDKCNPNPIVIMDTAEVLCEINHKPTSHQKKKAVDEFAGNCDDRISLVLKETAIKLRNSIEPPKQGGQWVIHSWSTHDQRKI